MTVGVIVAHPDDECLGAGGTIYNMALSDTGVPLLVLGTGLAARGKPTGQEKDALHEQLCASAKTLGIASIAHYDLPDNKFDSRPLLDIIKIIEEWLARTGCDMVLTHYGGDLNIDHRLVFQAVLTATRPMPGQTVKELYSFEVPSSTEWAFGHFGTFKPNVFVDIAETIETKIKAMKCYEGEMRPFPHPRSEEALRAIARRWGSVAGVEYAEAFELVRSLR